MNNSKPKILVVDDEPDLEMLIRQKFRKEIRDGKYNFVFAGNGVEALKKLNDDQEIELVLTDINMPEMDGLTLLAKIKELNNPLLHSVIVSAYGDILNIRTAMNGGAFDFVVKPIDLTDLEITINKAVDNLSTFKKALKSRDELMSVRKELEEARALQLSMLPASTPETNEFDFGVFIETASEVGGDYYDFTFKKDGSLNIAIGDATGHGMKAGIMVSIMKALFISDSSELHLIDFFSNSNKTIKALNLGRMMMAFTVLNINKNRVQFINAGMPPIFIYRNSTKSVVEFETQCMPLGAISEMYFKITEFEINSGDTILILSDGLPELFNYMGMAYGYERVQTEFQKLADKTPAEIIEGLKLSAAEWAKGTEPDDDITFVVIKVK
ncbi:MAG TPA: SpoIIE family protein phosphatase [Ignavibacteriaceae bacterium]|nr:SpoIIE family protein phosphatase [Ignavibacteriaceae bacterium]